MNKGVCLEGSIRLSDGNLSSNHVEICHNNAWSSACDGNTDTQLCKQLGFNSQGKFIV